MEIYAIPGHSGLCVKKDLGPAWAFGKIAAVFLRRFALMRVPIAIVVASGVR